MEIENSLQGQVCRVHCVWLMDRPQCSRHRAISLPLLEQKKIQLRCKIDYTVNGSPAGEQIQIDNFPDGI